MIPEDSDVSPYRCPHPMRHADITINEGTGIYCHNCGESYDHAIDARTGDRVQPDPE